MILSTVLNFVRAQTQTDSNGLTDTNGIIYANEALQDFHRRLITAGVDASQVQESYCDGAIPLVEGNGSTFRYPTDAAWLKAIELNYTDTTATNYKRASQVDVSNLTGDTSFSWLRKYANKSSPQFDDHGDWYEVFPAFTSADNLSQAIRIFYYLQPTQYTTVNDTVAYPESLDTTILGWRIAANYLYSLGTSKIPDGDKFMQRYEDRVKQYISTLGRGTQQPTETEPLPISGWQF